MLCPHGPTDPIATVDDDHADDIVYPSTIPFLLVHLGLLGRGSTVYRLISSPSPPPRPKLETVLFSNGKVDLADNDTMCFLQNKFRYITAKAFGRFDLVTLLCKL